MTFTVTGSEAKQKAIETRKHYFVDSRWPSCVAREGCGARILSEAGGPILKLPALSLDARP